MDQFIVRPGQKPVEEKTQVINVHRTVKGFYKASIMEPDASGNINEAFSTGWKPNTILNSGLDKIAYMPWAQTFQFCLIGDYPYTGADPVTASYDETMLKSPKRIHAFYLPGQGNCGHIVSGSTVRLFRTFDFYKEIDNVTYTEVGFKETPAATSLFSKIRFDPTMSLHAGQFMRVSYELRVNLNPATASAGGITPSPFPSFTGWTTGSLDKEAIQKIGLCGIDSGSGLAIPIDEGGFCNEPFAPGQLSFGPAFGFVNRYYNGSNVNYYPSASAAYEPNPFKAVGPLQEFDVGYANIYQLLDAGISASITIAGGKYSGSFCCPGTSTYLPRNYFTTDLIKGGYTVMGGSSIYSAFEWSGADLSTPLGRYSVVTVTAETGVTLAKTAFYYNPGGTNGKFVNLDNLWTPYSKIATLSSTGATPAYSSFLHNSNLFTDQFYDPSMQNSGSLSYPLYPSKLAVPGGAGTGSSYEPSNGILSGKEIAGNATKNVIVPRTFPYWDDWNPFTPTGSFPSPINQLSNYWVRGSSVFLSTHTGSATLFSASVDRSSNTGSKVFSFELPMSIVPYNTGSYFRDKYAIFTNANANNIDIPSSYWGGASAPAWRTIGIGPTSTNTNPSTMTDSAKYNGYVYVLENDQTKDKDYSLKVVFRYSWNRA
jgi:hypothetical protein